MIPLWVILGLGGVLFAVGGTMFDKYLLERYFNGDDQSGPGALLIFSAIFVVAVILFVVLYRYSEVDFGLRVGVVGIIAGAINGTWILMYLHAMCRSDVSKVVPLFQTVPVFGLVLGMIFLGEYLTLPQVAAATLIMIGGIILMYSRSSGRLRLDVGTMALTLGSAFFVALSHVVFKTVAVDANYWTAAFWLSIGFALFGAGLFACVGRCRQEFLSLLKHRRQRIFAINGVNELFDNVGELLFLAAVVLGPVALVQSINAYEPMLIFLCSLILMRIWPEFFHEDVSTTGLIQKSIGIAVISGGSLFLYTVI